MIQICGLSFTDVELEKYLEGFLDKISELLSEVLGEKTPIEYPQNIIILDPSDVKLSISTPATVIGFPNLIVDVYPVRRLFSSGVDYRFYIKEEECPESYGIVLRTSSSPRIYKVMPFEYRGFKWTVVMTTEGRPTPVPGWFFLFGIGPIPFHIRGYLSGKPNEAYLGALILGIPIEFLLKVVHIGR